MAIPVGGHDVKPARSGAFTLPQLMEQEDIAGRETGIVRRICSECQTDLPDGVIECEKCGCKNSTTGAFVIDEQERVCCTCGCATFKKTMHLNMNPNYITMWACSDCGNVVTSKEYYESPYM